MSKENRRFIKVSSEGISEPMEIWADTFTGILYLWHAAGYAGGLTPLLDKDGKPMCDETLISKDNGFFK